MKCSDCSKDFASNFLRPYEISEVIGNTRLPKILQLCKDCRLARKDGGQAEKAA